MQVMNAFKGISDMVRKAIEATMPRQAIVTRSEGKGVWVRYTPVDAGVPEAYFPSTVSGLPAGTAGWVHPLAGGKGRFIADAVPYPRAQSAGGYYPKTISTAGSLTWENAGIVFSGLPVGATFNVVASAQFRAQSGTGTGRFGFTVNDGTVRISPPNWDWIPVPAGVDAWIPASRVVPVTVGASGTVTVVPGIDWRSGTVSVNTIYLQAQLT